MFYRLACSIPDPSSATVLVTGGWPTFATVSRYGLEGWLEDLPPLNVGRREHGCGSYVSGGDLVSDEYLLSGDTVMLLLEIETKPSSSPVVTGRCCW